MSVEKQAPVPGVSVMREVDFEDGDVPDDVRLDVPNPDPRNSRYKARQIDPESASEWLTLLAAPGEPVSWSYGITIKGQVIRPRDTHRDDEDDDRRGGRSERAQVYVREADVPAWLAPHLRGREGLRGLVNDALASADNPV